MSTLDVPTVTIEWVHRGDTGEVTEVIPDLWIAVAEMVRDALKSDPDTVSVRIIEKP